jgi:hypothetical protein
MILQKIASTGIPPADPLEQFLIDHENLTNDKERREINETFHFQPPLLKINIPPDPLGSLHLLQRGPSV